MRRFLILAVVTVVLIVGIAALQGLSDFDLGDHDQTELTFNVDGITVAGTLVRPRSAAEGPIALIVHGDGSQDRFSDGGYLPLINTLLDAGIGVFTWDKPGIGRSDGNWLDQSMDDRADEVLAAYRMVLALPDTTPKQIGFIGFSQAGWVLPQAAGELSPAFTILVGAAVNWQRQGDYYATRRLEIDGLSDREITAQIEIEQARDDLFFAIDQVPSDSALGDLSRDRFGFIRRNRMADATSTIQAMTGPVLAIWGADDLNVDPEANAKEYAQLLLDPLRQKAIIIPQATHGLLRHRPFNAQLTAEWPAYIRWLFVVAGRRAYAPDALDQITDWIVSHTSQ